MEGPSKHTLDLAVDDEELPLILNIPSLAQAQDMGYINFLSAGTSSNGTPQEIKKNNHTESTEASKNFKDKKEEHLEKMNHSLSELEGLMTNASWEEVKVFVKKLSNLTSEIKEVSRRVSNFDQNVNINKALKSVFDNDKDPSPEESIPTKNHVTLNEIMQKSENPTLSYPEHYNPEAPQKDQRGEVIAIKENANKNDVRLNLILLQTVLILV